MSLSPTQSRIFGCLLALISSIALPAVGMFFKMIKEMFIAQTLLYRVTLTALLSIAPHLLSSEQSLIGDFEQNKWVTAVAVCMTACIGFQFLGITMMPFANFYALIHGGVLPLTLAVGKCWLKESCGVFKTLITCVILVAIVLISNPGSLLHFLTDDRYAAVAFQNNLTQLGTEEEFTNFTSDIKDDTDETRLRFIGIAISILECVLIATANLCARRVKVHYSIISIHISFWSIGLFTFLCAIFHGFSLPSRDDIIPLLGFAICGIIYQYSFFQALVFQPVGVVAVIATLEIPLSYILQTAFLHTFPGLLVSLGSGMITVATLVFGMVTLARQERKEYQEFSEPD